VIERAKILTSSDKYSKKEPPVLEKLNFLAICSVHNSVE